RAVKQLDGQLAGLMPHPGVPAEEVSIAELTQQLEAANKTKAAFDKGRETYQNAVRAQQSAQEAVTATEAEIARLQALLTTQQADLTAKAAAVEKAKADGFTLREALVDPQPILDKMRDAEAINRKVRENAQRDAVEVELAQEREAAQIL